MGIPEADQLKRPLVLLVDTLAELPQGDRPVLTGIPYSASGLPNGALWADPADSYIVKRVSGSLAGNIPLTNHFGSIFEYGETLYIDLSYIPITYVGLQADEVWCDPDASYALKVIPRY
jgi:hypothetical protein